MSEHHDLDLLDQRARAAATDLSTRAAARPTPAFDADRPLTLALTSTTPGPDRHRWQTGLAVAASLALVLGAIAWWAGRTDSSAPADEPITTTGDVRPYLAGELPAGFTLSGAGEITAPDADSGITVEQLGPLVGYGPTLDSVTLGVVALSDWVEPDTEDPDSSDPSTRIDVDGRDGYFDDGTLSGLRSLTAPVGEGWVLLVSPTMAVEDLVTAARTTTLDGDVATIEPSALPSGWVRLGRVAASADILSPMAALRGTATGGFYTAYQRGEWAVDQSSAGVSGDDSGGAGSASEGSAASADFAFVTISVTRGGETEVQFTRLVATDTRAVTVRGHSGVAGTLPATGGVEAGASLAWLERPGELVRITGYGVSVEEVADIAEGLQTPGDEEWDDLVQRSATGELSPSADQGAVMGTGRFADGTRWVLRMRTGDGDETASLDLSVGISGASSSTSGANSAGPETIAPPISSTATTEIGGRRFLAALLSDEVARVELRAATRTVAIAEPFATEQDGSQAVVVELTGEITDLVAIDSTGREVDRFAAGPGGEGPTQETVPVPTTTG